MSALTFSGINFFFSKTMDHGKKERQKLDLAIENIQRAKIFGMKI